MNVAEERRARAEQLWQAGLSLMRPRGGEVQERPRRPLLPEPDWRMYDLRDVARVIYGAKYSAVIERARTLIRVIVVRDGLSAIDAATVHARGRTDSTFMTLIAAALDEIEQVTP